MTEARTGALIPYLIEMFRYQAWVAMGKTAHPASGKVERNLDVSRAMIDMLAELETKTEGQRSPEESQALQGVLTDLRLNFLEEQKKPDPVEEPAEPAQEEEAVETGSDASSGDTGEIPEADGGKS